jgi:hypothetical protein
MSKLPSPKTPRALLISAGCPTPTPTVHYFVETRTCTLNDGTPAFEFIYECFKTGARRRWGYQERTLLTDVELEEEIEQEGN